MYRGEDYAARVDGIVAKLGLPSLREAGERGVERRGDQGQVGRRARGRARRGRRVSIASCWSSRASTAEGSSPCRSPANSTLPIIRIVPAGEFYDYHAKYVADDTQYLIPTRSHRGRRAPLQGALAPRPFEVLGCQDWGRADFMLGHRR
ncbi:MAG: hypothetical protein WDN30_06405 [Pararobbsia sp.]